MGDRGGGKPLTASLGSKGLNYVINTNRTDFMYFIGGVKGGALLV